ncbi:MAG: SRPBCC domain-containing protein [Actinomycetota bacterium]|nr:SRPBCC domain-containing protein [Actinomycetota bacterium]
MNAIATQLFRFATPAPAHRVWAALTTTRYLYGLAPSSDWRPGAAVVFAGEGTTLSGEVLAAEEPRRLSHSLRAGDGQPETYVTWEVAEDGNGSIVRLYVDEPAAPDDDAETESAWLHVVGRLQSVLAGSGVGDRRL